MDYQRNLRTYYMLYHISLLHILENTLKTKMMQKVWLVHVMQVLDCVLQHTL